MNDVTYGAPSPDPARDLGQALEAQQAVSPAQADSMARDFLARMQRDIDDQVDLRMKQQMATWKAPVSAANDMKQVAIATLIVGAIVTVAGSSNLGTGGIAIVWAAMVLVNVAWAAASLVRR